MRISLITVCETKENFYRQLLVRSRYLLFKNEDKWIPGQRQKVSICFYYYLFLKVAYKPSNVT